MPEPATLHVQMRLRRRWKLNLLHLAGLLPGTTLKKRAAFAIVNSMRVQYRTIGGKWRDGPKLRAWVNEEGNLEWGTVE
jgi:hypothetical protein